MLRAFRAGLALLAACFSPLALAADPPPGTILKGEVAAVHDGDTLTLLAPDAARHKIALAGVDAPELAQPFGPQAKQALADKLLGKQVELISQGQGPDGRTLGIVRFDGRVINLELVDQGFAWHFTNFNSKSLLTAQDRAKSARLGLWTDPAAVPPWHWRAKSQTAAKPIDDPIAAAALGGQTNTAALGGPTNTAALPGSSSPADTTPAPLLPTPDPAPQPGATSSAEKKYWITTSSGIRHNNACKYFRNSKGRDCTSTDGRPCKICGG